MKKLLLFIAMAAAFASCSKDDNNTTCPEWTEGPGCATETRTKYYGTYTGRFTQDGQAHDNINITLSPGSTKDRVRSDMEGAELILSSSTAGDFTFAYGKAIGGGWYTANGSSGRIYEGKMSFTIQADDGQGLNSQHSTTITFVGTKQ